MKFLLLGIGGLLLAVFMWQSEGLLGKTIVIITAIFIIASAVIKTHSKFLNDKIEHQRDKIISERMEKRMDKLQDNLGEMSIHFQKYLDESKKGDDK
jgi:hypothetical protein